MAELKNYADLKNLILADATVDNQCSENSVMKVVLENYLIDSKRVDNTELEIGYFNAPVDNIQCKINGFMKNESEERLQIFVFDEESILSDEEFISVTKKDRHESYFKKSLNFLKKSIGGYFHNSRIFAIDDIPDQKIRYFVNDIVSNTSKKNLDYIEIFLVSLTVARNTAGKSFSTKKFDFSSLDRSLKIKYEEVDDNASVKKKINRDKVVEIEYNLVDLNYLYEVHTSINGREPIEIELEESDYLETIEVAQETGFHTYLTVIPAKILADFYKRYSYRLLERNVRSFLDFKTVNRGMRDTMKTAPYKFIAFNNGLTITCNKLETVEVNGKLFIRSMEDFQIVNGGQTTASIYFSSRDGIDVSKVNVMAKINVLDSGNEDFEALVTDISKYSNTQNKVNIVDLRSNNSILVALKNLSDTIADPQGRKWIYERSRGEIQTLRRLSGLSAAAFNAKYPTNLRLKSADIAKYYSSWGDEPHNIKKGGEKVFSGFMTKLEKKKTAVDRNFYENLIARVILFTNLESIHGVRDKALGQLRAAVVPYSISCLYHYCSTLGTGKENYSLDFDRYWSAGKIDETSEKVFYALMKNMYGWISKYRSSDDISENTKKESLWNSIKNSKELKKFYEDNKDMLAEITVNVPASNSAYYDFSDLLDSVKYHVRGRKFYTDITADNRIILSLEQIDRLYALTDNKIKKIEDIEKNIQKIKPLLNINILYETANSSKVVSERKVREEISKKTSYDIIGGIKENLENTLDFIAEKNNGLNMGIVDNEYLFLNKCLDMVIDAYYKDFDELYILDQINVSKNKSSIKYHLEFLEVLKKHGIMPSIIDLYQLKPLVV